MIKWHNFKLKWTVFLIALVLGNLRTQCQDLVNVSYNPVEDSVFFEKMQQRMAEIRKTRPTVALVLAGGGAKGISHIGVLKYLEERGIPVDFVAGTSMGGLVGGLYSLGYSAFEIDSLAKSIDWQMMMNDNVPLEFYSYKRRNYMEKYRIDIPFSRTAFVKSLPSGFKYGLNIYNLLNSVSVGYQHKMDFIDLPTPFCCVATEIVTQKEKHWVSGELVDALRSTMSIPGYFKPVRVDSMILSDGGTQNNFPVDVALAAGADIIIGVELNIPYDYTKMNNVADILMQTVRYSRGMEAHTRNVSRTTVYITPDVTGFGMLSFGQDEVRTLIDRGYAEGVKHGRTFDSIVALVGDSGRQLHNAKAINISNTKVRVTAIEYEGVDDKEKRYLGQLINLDKEGYYSKEDLEIAQAIIFGTMAFSDVTYHLTGNDTEGYRIMFRCHKRLPNSIGIGMRADSEEWFSVLVNFGFGKNKIYGSSFDVTARLSISPYLKLEYAYLPPWGPQIGVAFKSQFRMMFGNVGYNYNFRYYKQFWRNELRAFIASAHWSQVNLQAGIRVEHLPYYKEFGEVPDPLIRPFWDWKVFSPYVYLRFAFDRKNNLYFSDRGFKINVSYDYNFHKTHFLAAGMQGIIPVCKFFVIQASMNGRYILGKDNPNENENMDNYVGGLMAGRYYEQQIPFVGLNGELNCDDLLTTVDMELRFKVAKKYFLSLIGAAMHDGDSIASLKVKKTIFAAAFQFGYKSKFGPLMANIHWNSLNNKVGFYVGAGYNF